MKLRWLLPLLLISCNAYWSPQAVAQAVRGAVAGTTKDSGGGTLQGARVVLEPTDKTVITDEQGQFHIGDAAPGNYTSPA